MRSASSTGGRRKGEPRFHSSSPWAAAITSVTIGTTNDANGFAITDGAVPEPSTWAIILIGFAGLGYAGLRRRAKRNSPAFAD